MSIRIFLLLGVLALAGLSHANGKFFRRDELPTDMPYQRALLIHRDGQQTLVVESTFQGATGETSWILPLPARPTLIRPVPATMFQTLTERSGPSVERLRFPDPLILWLLAALGVFLVTLFVPRWATGQPYRWAVYLLCAAVAGAALPWGCHKVLHGSRGGESSEAGPGVTSDGWTNLGPYKQTLLSGPGDQVLEWFDANRFRVSEEDRRVIREYAANGWVFHLSRLRVEEAGHSSPPPLMVVFPTDRPVYPMRLTGVGADRLTLDLFTVADPPLVVPGMDVWAARTVEESRRYGVIRFRIFGPMESDLVGSMMWRGATIVRQRAQLTAAQMRDDLWPQPVKGEVQVTRYQSDEVRRNRWAVPLVQGACLTMLLIGFCISIGLSRRWWLGLGAVAAVATVAVAVARVPGGRPVPIGELQVASRTTEDEFRRFLAFEERVRDDRTWTPETVERDLPRLVNEAGLLPGAVTWLVFTVRQGTCVMIQWEGSRDSIAYVFNERGNRQSTDVWDLEFYPFNSPESLWPPAAPDKAESTLNSARGQRP